MVHRRALMMGFRCLLATALLLGALGMGAPSLADPPAGWMIDALDPHPDSHVETIVVQPDGKILMGGFFGMVGDVSLPRLARLNPDGSLDDAFDPPAPQDRVRALALDGDGRIIVAAKITDADYIARLHQDGSLDDTFAPGADDIVFALAMQPDGKIVVGGRFTTIGGLARTHVARLHPDGTPDESFNAVLDGEVYAVVLQPDGKLLIGGPFDTVNGVARSGLARLHPDGTLDETLAVDADGPVFVVGLHPNGHILLGGSFGSVNGEPRRHFARLSPQGAVDDLDPGFGLTGQVHAIVSDADGRIILGGLFSWLPVGATDHLANLAIIDTDGDLVADPTLHVNGFVIALALQADGSLLIGGQFSEIGRQAQRWCMGRLTNPTRAVQSLTYDAAPRSATWHRSGASPEVWRATLELSTDGVTYTSLGEGVRVDRGWAWEDLALPPGQDLWLRARGYHTTGGRNASISVVETIAELPAGPVLVLHHLPIALR